MTMIDRINTLLEEVEAFTTQSKEQVEEYRIKWLSKKGEVSSLFDDFKNVPGELKKEVGQKLNLLKTKAQEKINELNDALETNSSGAKESFDLTLPGFPTLQNGTRHPLTLVKNQIIDIFARIGFTISDGKEIE